MQTLDQFFKGIKCICQRPEYQDKFNQMQCEYCNGKVHKQCYEFLLNHEEKDFMCINCRLKYVLPFYSLLTPQEKTRIIAQQTPQNKQKNDNIKNNQQQNNGNEQFSFNIQKIAPGSSNLTYKFMLTEQEYNVLNQKQKNQEDTQVSLMFFFSKIQIYHPLEDDKNKSNNQQQQKSKKVNKIIYKSPLNKEQLQIRLNDFILDYTDESPLILDIQKLKQGLGKNEKNRQPLKIGINQIDLTIQGNYNYQRHSLFGVYWVQNRDLNQFFKEICVAAKPVDTKNFELCKVDFMQAVKNNNQEELQWNEQKISLIDPTTKELLKYPARGVNCKHLTCFSLLSFLKAMSNLKGLVSGQWHCLICEQPIYWDKLKFFLYLHKMIQENQKKIMDNLDNVYIMSNGDLNIREIDNEMSQNKNLILIDENEDYTVPNLKIEQQEGSTDMDIELDNLRNQQSVVSEQQDEIQIIKHKKYTVDQAKEIWQNYTQTNSQLGQPINEVFKLTCEQMQQNNIFFKYSTSKFYEFLEKATFLNQFYGRATFFDLSEEIGMPLDAIIKFLNEETPNYNLIFYGITWCTSLSKDRLSSFLDLIYVIISKNNTLAINSKSIGFVLELLMVAAQQIHEKVQQNKFVIDIIFKDQNFGAIFGILLSEFTTKQCEFNLDQYGALIYMLKLHIPEFHFPVFQIVEGFKNKEEFIGYFDMLSGFYVELLKKITQNNLVQFIEFMQKIYLPPTEDINYKDRVESRAALYFLYYFCQLIQKYQPLEENQIGNIDIHLNEMLKIYDIQKEFQNFCTNKNIFNLHSIISEIHFS